MNIGVDTILRESDLLNLVVSDLVTESGKVKTELRVKMMKTKKNTLLMFPPWLYHKVAMNREDTNRISIAFNTVCKKNEWGKNP